MSFVSDLETTDCVGCVRLPRNYLAVTPRASTSEVDSGLLRVEGASGENDWLRIVFCFEGQELSFKAPQFPRSWKGHRKALIQSFGSSC